MIVGFTGTREGMTEHQRAAFRLWILRWLSTTPGPEFHHGVCLGADEQAVGIITATLIRCRIVGHPGNWGPLTSKAAASVSHPMLPCRPMLDRNRDIVDAAEVLLACPKGPEERRSGTWATVRYARRTGKRVVFFWPDGSVTEDQGRERHMSTEMHEPPAVRIRVVRVNRLRTPEQRATVVYCGRAFAGWPASSWQNPYSVTQYPDALARFRSLAADQPPAWLDSLWTACDRGRLPLGCWCVEAVAGDGSSVVCHAQILAEMLRERFAP